MYLPLQYHSIKETEPNFKGPENHSVEELKEICKRFKEYTHQQSIIKQNLMKHVV